MKTIFKPTLLLVAAFCLVCSHTTETAARQQTSNTNESPGAATQPANRAPASTSLEERLKALEQIIERQQREIEALKERVQVKPQEAAARAVAASTQPAGATATDAAATNAAKPAQADTPQTSTEKRVDELYKKFGAIRFSGDVRFRVEPFHNQGFDNPADAPSRTRLRVRARLALDGSLNKNFDWGFRLATGIFTDPISTNQTLTDFFERKPFALDRAFIRYDSKTDDVGLQLVAGKFEPTFRRTQMIWDDDVNVEGASEAVYFKTDSSLKQIKLVAFQLPFDEQSGAKDGVLYGGQLQTDWKLSSSITANVNVAYYDWVRADRVVLALGAATQATATQVNGGITSGAGVTGGQNGSLGTTNRLIRAANGNVIGLLAGFNLFDVLGQITWQPGKSRFPVTATFDFVRNMTGRVADEKNGYWAGLRVGQARERGDWLFEYTFTRIEQDAVLVPFNFSDILASNSRAHLPTIAYQLSDGVTLQWNGLFSQRVNKVFPTSDVNRLLNRMQFDVIYKF